MSGQDPLPGMPPAPQRAAPAPRSGERVSRYNPKAKRLCDACIFLIHRYGQAGAGYPRAARWRVATDERSRYLCEQHKETRL